MTLAAPWLLGGLALLVLWLVVGILSGRWNPWTWSVGLDGRPSTSKLQAQLWTVVVLYTYLVLGAARLLTGNFVVDTSVPQNLLLAMGMSIGTGVVAAQVRATQETRRAERPVAAGLAVVSGTDLTAPASSTPTVPARYEAQYLFVADDQAPDLAKTQLLAWTLVSLAAYVLATVRVVHDVLVGGVAGLPDIDPTLMLLMGIGQAGYIGQKIVDASKAGA